MWQEDQLGKKYWVEPLSGSGCLGVAVIFILSTIVAVWTWKLIIKGAVIAWKMIF